METEEVDFNKSKCHLPVKEQIEYFQKNGAVYLKPVASSDEIIFFLPAINNTVNSNSRERRNLQKRDNYDTAFLQVMNLWEVNEEVKKFIPNTKFTQIAATLLGVNCLRIYHARYYIKNLGEVVLHVMRLNTFGQLTRGKLELCGRL